MQFLLVAILCVQVLGQAPPVPHEPEKKMTLTPGDLKRFSGHALSLIQAKCPKVQTSTIFELNKFIGKAIAKDTDPIPGNDVAFRGVLDSLRTCANKKVVQKHETEKDDMVPQSSDEVPEIFFFAPADGDRVELVPDSDEREIMTKIESEKTEKHEFEVEPTNVRIQVPVSPIGGENVRFQVPVSPIGEEKPTGTTERPRNPFVVWVSSVLSSVREFFSRMYGTRQRREATEPETPYLFNSGIVHHGRTTTTDSSGKDAFMRLFTEACRLYCDKCVGIDNTRVEFKKAANQLLEHLFKIVPVQGLDLAATNHLSKEFMQTLVECE